MNSGRMFVFSGGEGDKGIWGTLMELCEVLGRQQESGWNLFFSLSPSPALPPSLSPGAWGCSLLLHCTQSVLDNGPWFCPCAQPCWDAAQVQSCYWARTAWRDGGMLAPEPSLLCSLALLWPRVRVMESNLKEVRARRLFLFLVFSCSCGRCVSSCERWTDWHSETTWTSSCCRWTYSTSAHGTVCIYRRKL